jgi:hypothetical protein
MAYLEGEKKLPAEGAKGLLKARIAVYLGVNYTLPCGL